MKVTITTDDGTLLETIDGADHGCSDDEILSGTTKDDLGGIVEDAIDNEILAMIRRGKPS